MILEEETFKVYGYYPKDLSYGSNRRILAKCDECGKIRKTCKYDYRDLCYQCAIKKLYQTLTEKDKKENSCMIGILEQETYDKFGYYSNRLKPQSRKMVLVRCIECEKIREIRKYHYHDLCGSCAQKERLKKSEDNPFYNKHHTKETKEKISNAQKGEKSYMWKGGMSFEPYCILFDNNFKERIREYWNRKCILCDKNEIDNRKKLSVHHVTYNKDVCCDDSPHLFVPLCVSCHAKTNHNRAYWENKFKRIIYSRNIDGNCFYTREEMEEIKKG